MTEDRSKAPSSSDDVSTRTGPSGCTSCSAIVVFLALLATIAYIRRLWYIGLFVPWTCSFPASIAHPSQADAERFAIDAAKRAPYGGQEYIAGSTITMTSGTYSILLVEPEGNQSALDAEVTFGSKAVSVQLRRIVSSK